MLAIIFCSLFVISCKECEEVNPTNISKRLKEFQVIRNDTIYQSYTYKYKIDNTLTDIYLNNEKIIHFTKINDTLLEINYYWTVYGEKINAVLRADIQGIKIERLYEYNKVLNEIKDVKFEYQYVGDELQSSSSTSVVYFLDNIHQYNFEYMQGNIVSMYMDYYYREPFSGFREFRQDTLFAEYTDIPFNKYIPFQNTLDYENVTLKNNQFGAHLSPLYILGINNYYCNTPNKNLVKNFEIITGYPYKINSYYNYEIENNYVLKMAVIDDSNYFKLIWE